MRTETTLVPAPWGVCGLRRVLGLVGMCFALMGTTAGGDCHIDGHYVMGTVFQMTVCPTGGVREASSTTVIEEVFREVERLDALLTTYSSYGPVVRLNEGAGLGFQTVPEQLAEILRISHSYTKKTRGAFDVTVGPLLSLWRSAEHSGRVPSRSAIGRALTSVGSDKMEFQGLNDVALRQPAMSLDLGGIAKGYALDRVVQVLRERGVGDALLNFGHSSLWALGSPSDTDRWRLLLRWPSGKKIGVASFSDHAVSISGTYGSTTAIEDRRYGNIIDPRSGEPVGRDLLACVVGQNAAEAEALSTALLIIGELSGIELLESIDGVEGMLIESNGGAWTTTGWEQASRFSLL